MSQGEYDEIKSFAMDVGGGDKHIACTKLLDILSKRATLYAMRLERLALNPSVNQALIGALGGQLLELRDLQRALNELVPGTSN